MVSSRDSRIIDFWLERQSSPHTRGSTGATLPAINEGAVLISLSA